MRQMTRLVSIVVVYPADADFDGVVKTLEGEFLTRLEVSEHERMGVARACILDVRVPDTFALHTAQQRLEEAMPTVRIKALERFRGSWWGRYRRDIAIAVGGGLAVALIVDLVRLLLARLRDLPGAGST